MQMIKHHYEYIGYPRTGTTFLYSIFKKHPYFVDCFKNLQKENSFLGDGGSIEEYTKLYAPYTYSMNMYTATRSLNSTQIIELNKITDKFFLILRNPYELLNSLLQFHGGGIYMLYPYIMSQLNYVSLLARLERLIPSKKLRIFIFDDLEKNKKLFVQEIFKFLNVPYYETSISGNEFLNSSKTHRYNSLTRSVEEAQTDTILLDMALTIKHITEINSQIDQLTQYLNRDFSSWKR